MNCECLLLIYMRKILDSLLLVAIPKNYVQYVHTFVHSFTFWFVHSFVCSFVYSFVCSFVCSYVCSFVRTFVRTFVRSFVRLFIRSFIHSFVNSSIHSTSVSVSSLSLFVTYLLFPFCLFRQFTKVGFRDFQPFLQIRFLQPKDRSWHLKSSSFAVAECGVRVAALG